MVDNASFWDKAADKYVASPMKDTATYQKWLARVKAQLKPTDKVVELGCGSGATARELAPSVAEMTATDISAQMINHAKAADSPANITYKHAVLGDADLAGPYDAVLAFNVLHLMEGPEQALNQIHAMLAPGGLFISKTATISKFSPLRLIIGAMQLVGKAPHLNYFTKPELEAAISQAGFDVLEAEQYPAKGMTRLVVARKI